MNRPDLVKKFIIVMILNTENIKWVLKYENVVQFIINPF
jgi:hypothetical protein